MEMEKKLLEELVRRVVPIRVELTHTGNHFWESPKIPTMLCNAGLFTALFSHVSLKVQAEPPDADTPDYQPLNIRVRWYSRDGGENGARLFRYWHPPSNTLLTVAETTQQLAREQAPKAG
jgi:hypothetical protein